MGLRTMGIDPGLTHMGLGIVEQEGNRLTALACDTIVTSPADSVPRRLDTVFEALSAAIGQWRPDAVAIERIFYKMNARTLVPVAQASGVALLAAARAGAGPSGAVARRGRRRRRPRGARPGRRAGAPAAPGGPGRGGGAGRRGAGRGGGGGGAGRRVAAGGGVGGSGRAPRG